MRSTAAIIVAGGVVLAVGCASPTLQQRTAPYPGYGQSQAQMLRDSAECESWARDNAGEARTAESAAGGALLGSALGAGAGAIAGSFFGAAGTGAALGASLGGVRGATGGAASSAAAWDQRLVQAYQNCMAARGYVMSGSVAMPPPPPAQQETARGDDQTMRLDAIQRLYDQGLITPMEYERKRAEIRAAAMSPSERLQQLTDLLDAGLITKKEYAEKRKRILDEI